MCERLVIDVPVLGMSSTIVHSSRLVGFYYREISPLVFEVGGVPTKMVHIKPY